MDESHSERSQRKEHLCNFDLCSKYTLTEPECDRTFKNLLRADDKNVYKEHKAQPFKERKPKEVKDLKNIFDDKYNSKVVVSKKDKFEKNYVNGNLKTNVIFDDQFKSNKVERLTHVRTKNEIDKLNPDFQTPRKEKNITQINEAKSAKEYRLKKISDTYSRNPINVTPEVKINSARLNNISKFMSSEGFKSAVCSHPVNELTTYSDKITNKPKSKQNHDEPKIYIKSFRHVVDKNKVYYP